MKKLLILFSIATLTKLAVAQNADTPPVVTVPPEGAQVRLNVMQNGEALVSDRRSATLPAGRSQIRLTHLPNPDELKATLIQPFITGPGAVDLLEQRFQGSYSFGVTEAVVLGRHVGQTVTVQRAGEPTLKGTLLMAGDVVLLDTADGLVVNPHGTFVVPRATDTIADRSPSALTWLANAAAAGQYSIEARYITKGLSWQPLYSASFNAAGDRIMLRGWLKVVNSTQVNFRAAQLSLQDEKSSRTAFYKHPLPFDLLANSSQQLAYVAGELPVARELVYAPTSIVGFTKGHNGSPQVTLRLQNSAANGLGLPLPPGPLIIWGVTADGLPTYIADRTIPAVAPDQEFRIELGDAPGVSASREVADSRQLNPRTMEYTIQITLRNEQTTPVTVSVIENFPDGAKITESNPKPTAMQGADRAEYRVVVPAEGAAVVKYVVEIKS